MDTMRTMFSIYLLFTIGLMATYAVIGLSHH